MGTKQLCTEQWMGQRSNQERNKKCSITIWKQKQGNLLDTWKVVQWGKFIGLSYYMQKS